MAAVVELARRLLWPAATGRSGLTPPTPGVLARVARLRDELHATTNRVERFRLTDRPSIDPVRVHATTAATTMLSPGQVLHQLDLVAARLAAVLDALQPPDWHRVADVGDATLTPGPLVDDVLHAAYHDLLDIIAGERQPA